jgi:hypothetical protein
MGPGAELELLRKTTIEPLELDAGETVTEDADEFSRDTVTLLRLTDPWLLSVGVTLFLVVPTLVTFIVLIKDLIGRIWPASLFAVHLVVALWTAKAIVPTIQSPPIIIRRLVPSLLDMFLFGYLYTIFCDSFVSAFFTDVDGTPVIEYESYRKHFVGARMVGRGVAVLRLIIEATALVFIWQSRHHQIMQGTYQLPRSCASALAWFESRGSSWSAMRNHRFRIGLRRIFWLLLLASVVLLFWCLVSVLVHLIRWSAPTQHGSQCDPLDTTECSLPFPSFHSMVKDNTTDTGWRVELRGDALPPLKGGVRLDPSGFLNQLDGFSTMAPLLFYMDGLKEAHQLGGSSIQMQGADNIDLSVTNRSITLLLDVDSHTLVPHTAEVDYLDSKRPVVLVFPSSPLRHNAHYALAVLQATDVHGRRLPPTPGMQSLMSGKDDFKYKDRRYRYETVVIPALHSAAPWFSYDKDPESLQLLFDFQTISAKSQLGPVRAVRDATLAYIGGTEWGDWSEHVRAIRIDEGVCSKAGTLIARTIHAELDVPWFLKAFGSGHREAILDGNAVSTGKPVTVGISKFVVHIPCSLRAAAIKGANAVDLRAVMEYGHGLFYNRDEATDHFLLE